MSIVQPKEIKWNNTSMTVVSKYLTNLQFANVMQACSFVIFSSRVFLWCILQQNPLQEKKVTQGLTPALYQLFQVVCVLELRLGLPQEALRTALSNSIRVLLCQSSLHLRVSWFSDMGMSLPIHRFWLNYRFVSVLFLWGHLKLNILKLHKFSPSFLPSSFLLFLFFLSSYLLHFFYPFLCCSLYLFTSFLLSNFPSLSLLYLLWSYKGNVKLVFFLFFHYLEKKTNL